MSIPVFDPIQLPPNHVLEDINGIADEEERQTLQAAALEYWMEDMGEDPLDAGGRDWSDNEGIFAVCDTTTGDCVGIAIVTDVQAL